MKKAKHPGRILVTGRPPLWVGWLFDRLLKTNDAHYNMPLVIQGWNWKLEYVPDWAG